MYESHATQYAPQLDLKLTKKQITSGVTVDFAGFPSRALDRYLDILVNRLQCKVALCEQLGAVTRQDKSVIAMDRKITRIITPGTVIEERFLDSNQNNYLLSISPPQDDQSIGLAWADVSVGEFVMQHTTMDNLKDDLARIRPREVILPESLRPALDQEVMDPIISLIFADTSIAVSFEPDDHFKKGTDMFKWTTHDFSAVEVSAGTALLNYVNESHVNRKPKWQPPARFSVHDTVRIDSAAMTSLEIVKTLQGKRADSLLSVIDRTCTSAGSRLLQQWISSPLTSIPDIRQRLSIVEFFCEKDRFLLDDVRNLLKQSTDAQRAIQRLALKRGQHSDLFEVCDTLDIMQLIRDKLNHVEETKVLMKGMDPHPTLATRIKTAFNQEQVQNKETEYGFVNHDFHPELSQLHQELDQLFTERDKLQDNLRDLCGQSVSLLRDSGPFKHIIELTASKSKQFLETYPQATHLNHTKSKKRFQIPEWTSISTRIQTCESQIIDIETQVYQDIVNKVLDESTTILQSCRKLAQLDTLCSFAHVSIENHYVKPRITKTNRTMIIGGRHPVVESNLMKKGKSFVTNDCDLTPEQRIWLLTGPNMGGKSTFLRQYVIIVLLAHVGCFVPADRASIGVTDRIFSRVGAADNLAQNQSTFMMEMSEVSTILKQATQRSTVIMDEVGRGTSTQDGVSLAYGILDYLHNDIQCRTLFATHHHELADMMHAYDKMQCYQTSIQELPMGGFRFVHKVMPGVCRQSHGIQVAQIAGI